jgi:hypothetical protein
LKNNIVYAVSAVVTLVLSGVTLDGCSSGSFPDVAAPTIESGAVVTPPIQGSVYGGHAPLVGAQVYVLTPSLTALYGQSASLMDGDTQNAGLTPSGTSNGLVSAGGTIGYHYVPTDLSGGFSLSGDYACTVNQAVYLVAVGGSPTYPSGTNIFNIAGANGATAGSATETAIGGTVTNIAITAAGSGLVNGTYTVDATGGGGSGAVASVVVSGNKVTSVTITDAGTGYTSAPTFTSTAWNPFIGAHTEPTLTATVSTIYDDIQFTVSTTNVAGQAGPPELFSIGETVDFSGLTGTLATVVGSSGAVIATGLTTTTFDVQVSPGTAGLTTGSTSLPVAAGATATGVPTANPAAINMTALGLCPSSGSFAGSVSYIFMNEVSTAAMAIATAAFGNGPFNVGVKTGGTVDAHLANYDANGLKQALNNASLLYDFTGTNVSTTYAGEGHARRERHRATGADGYVGQHPGRLRGLQKHRQRHARFAGVRVAFQHGHQHGHCLHHQLGGHYLPGRHDGADRHRHGGL